MMGSKIKELLKKNPFRDWHEREIEQKSQWYYIPRGVRQ